MVDPRIVEVMEIHEKLTELLPKLQDQPLTYLLVSAAVKSLGLVPAPELPEGYEARHRATPQCYEG